MSFSSLTYIYCDFCKADDPACTDPLPNLPVWEQRLMNRTDGWSVLRLKNHNYDRCPDCTKEGRREPTILSPL